MLNPHTFPLLPYPGLAPELAARAGQGGWGAYAQAAPHDRFLPFVLTRAIRPSNPAWVNCAYVVHADTGDVLFSLVPTGKTASSPGNLGLVLDKVVDTVNGREHFLYYGAQVPTLALPCGVPLRLLLDNEWQSPRFEAYNDLSGYQRYEWSHPGPLSGVPYGTGLLQRFYQPNGGLQYAAPRTVVQSTQDGTTGYVREDYVAEYGARRGNVEPVPAYLADAFAGARAHKQFTVDGQAWRLTEVKEAEQGQDGGRWSLSLSLEDLEPLISRLACLPNPLVAEVYDPVRHAVRRYHCGDSSDTDSDYLPTGIVPCELDPSGRRTGYALIERKDRNRFSATFGNIINTRTYDAVACPLPVVYYSAYYSEEARKNDCPTGQLGSSVPFISEQGKFTSLDNQADADQQAIDYVQANKQAYANQTGVCSGGPGGAGNGRYEPVYASNGCFSGYMANSADPNDVRNATTDELSQYGGGTDNYGQPCPG